MPTTTRPASLKRAIYEQIARIGQATASPNRLELLDLLSQGARTVEALAHQTGQSVATTSHHLQVLRRARLVEARKAGLYVTYRLADPHVGEFFLQLRRLSESRLAELQQVTRQYLEERGALEAIGNNELVRRVRAGEVTLIDVRPREEYLAAHIPGAISVPLADLGKRLGELQKRRDIVAYCRGPYCVMALDAVDLLRRKGFRAHRMEHGVPEWRAQGLRVETGDSPHACGRR
ncbi:MAG TPA: metalloregulator ArsR/SmtB family transcription factor [Vicinamibacterales bacterium]|nr:metalloregulator ArsR/SmtB family transcription factor [Vicinamibacterales bacterium]